MSAVDLVKWLVDLLHFIFIYRRGVVTCQHSRLSSITMLYKTPLSGNILTFGTFWPSFRHFPSPKYIVCWAETSKKIFLHIWYNILCKKTHPTIEFGFRYPSVGDSAGPLVTSQCYILVYNETKEKNPIWSYRVSVFSVRMIWLMLKILAGFG